MTVAEIHFNHDPGSAKNDAINLRLDHTDGSEIVAPEWLDGVAPKPVAYAAAAITGPVTIKVKFKDGPPGGSLNIRAVRPGGNQLKGPMRTREVLGDVETRSVRFNSAGHSALETFEITADLAAAGVGVFKTAWEWQANHGGDWVTFAGTENRTYVVHALPKEPWNQALVANIGWPWAKALDQACAWAFGAATIEEAAAAVAMAINLHPRHRYDEDGRHLIVDDRFLLSTYLSELKVAPITIDCSGITAVMVTFANLLGAGLMPLRIQNVPKAFFHTKNIAAVGVDWTNPIWTTEEWARHEIAVVPESLLDPTGLQLPMIPETLLPTPAAEDVRIYDASMHVDESSPVVPIRMRLGSVAGQSDYRFKLIEDTKNGDAATPKVVLPVI